MPVFRAAPQTDAAAVETGWYTAKTTMSFNYYFRKAADPSRPIWQRWSAVHSCLQRLQSGDAPSTFAATHASWIERWNIGPKNPPTDAHIFQALTELAIRRNRRTERLRSFARKRIREKMQGRRALTRAQRAQWKEINRL